MPDKNREGSPATVSLRSCRELHHRCDKGGGYAMPRHIGDEQSHLVVIRNDVVVKIACHGTHGHIPGGYSEVHGNWEFAWQNG